MSKGLNTDRASSTFKEPRMSSVRATSDPAEQHEDDQNDQDHTNDANATVAEAVAGAIGRPWANAPK